MNEGFIKFVKKARLAALLKSLAYSVSAALAIFAVLLLLDKREIVTVMPLYSALVALGAFALIEIPLFFILRPTDLAVSKLLDRELSLGERVQTAYEFSDREGSMLDLQRDDTAAKLAAIPTSALRIKRTGAAIAVLLVSASMLLTSLIIPALAEPESPEVIVDGYEKDWRIAELRQLIQRVKSDPYAEAPLREEIVEELELLITAVEATDIESAMKVAAVTAVGEVNDLLSSYNSSVHYSTTLAESELDALVKLSRAFASLDDGDAEDAIDDIKALLISGEVEVTLPDFNSRFSVALRQSGVTREEDLLYQALVGFSNSLTMILDTAPSDATSQIRDLCDELVYSVSDALFLQYDNKRIADTVVAEIIRIFSLTKDDFLDGGVLPPVDSETGELVTPPDDEDDEQESGNTGGYGSGETLAGSNDSIYDNDRDDFVKYIDVINKYYGKFDSLSGELPDAVRDAVQSYFDKLFTPGDLLN